MIIVTSRANPSYTSELDEMFRLRKHIFYDTLRYKTSINCGFEHDEYDKDDTIYIINTGSHGVHSFVRLNPTTERYMIADLWPDVMTAPAPRSRTIVEGSRIAVNPALAGAPRKHAVLTIVRGMYAYCLRFGLEGIVGVMPPRLWSAVFTARGLPFTWLSKPFFTAGPNGKEPARIAQNTVSLHCLWLLTGE